MSAKPEASDKDKSRKRPIIIKKRKVIAGGHHGGAWKVAYADFVTAMMAFFMVMWLVSSVNKEQRAALFEYFNNPSMEQGKATKPAPGQNGPGGSSTSPIDLGGGLDAPKSQGTVQAGFPAPPSTLAPGNPAAPAEPSVDEARRIADEAERQQLEALMADLRAAIENSKTLAEYKEQLLIDITPEGLRIQIVDAQSRPMFDLGSSRLKNYTDTILKELSGYLNSVPNRVSLTGHTDTTPYSSLAGYTNWELSADRANAARRALEAGGMSSGKIARVVGLSSSVLFDKANPRNPINRRISIIVMNKRAEAAALQSDVPGAPGAATSTGASQSDAARAAVTGSLPAAATR
jgi:chemotaxis protein MotB